MKRAVSVSLGSSQRNKNVVIHLNDTPISVERIGTDGDEKLARQKFAELDGTVDALGVGGVELALRLAGRIYPLQLRPIAGAGREADALRRWRRPETHAGTARVRACRAGTGRRAAL